MITPEQRIAVAELCPKTLFRVYRTHVYFLGQDETMRLWSSYSGLNAMHVAEKALDAELGEDIAYRENLIEEMSSEDGCHPEPWIWHATEEERVKAFLKTKAG